ncbi:MAG: hypothetical protein JRN15_14930 [Nitrososphaerota archaeon]|nr:hypothetical protein [Nitrososphaerota archaeon]
MLFFAQEGNRERIVAARQHLSDVMLRPRSERVAARKKCYEEQAGMAGVVTINQADATFIDLNVHAFDQMGQAFAEFAALQFGQAAVYKTRQEYAIGVNMGHLAGGPPSVLFHTSQAGVQVQPFTYFSEEFLVPNLVNAQFNLEAFKERDVALARVARDMRLIRQQYIINTMLNQPLSQSIATSLANYYALTAPWANRSVYVLDPGVDSGSVVTTNSINDTAEGGLTKNVFKSIRSYCNRAPQIDDEAISPRSLFIPITGAPWEAYWDQASIVGYSATGNSNLDTSKAIPANKWDEAVGMSFERNGAYMNWFGTQVFVQPTNVLPSGYCLLATNKPAVLGWDQYSASVSDEEGRFGDRAMNRRYEARTMALAQPDPLAANFVVLKIS